MAASDAERRPRRGPAPIASFDHDVSDESSPENKQAIRLPDIREDPASSTTNIATTSIVADCLAPPEHRARSHSSPSVHATASLPSTSGLQTPAAPRIDISRASSSSHHDSRDSSPELALFSGGGATNEDARARLELGFREDGAADLRSSTEELAFLEGAPVSGEVRSAPAAPPSRRHSRKDSQSSEAALLAVSGRTSRLSSVGSQCSAHSALSGFSHASHISRLSVVSGTSRSPSPHKMLLETSFCGPKPIETDPEICAAVVEERLLEIAKLSNQPVPSVPDPQIMSITQVAPVSCTPPIRVDARDRREVRTEVTVENPRPASAPRLTSPNAPSVTSVPVPATSTTSLDDDKRLKETRNRAKVEERRARSRERQLPQADVNRQGNRSKDIIRIRLKPEHEYEDDDEDESERTLISGEPARKPVTLELNDRPARPIDPVSPRMTPRLARDSRTPSPTGVAVSRKSSFCSLFKSRETIASPDSPSETLRRKKSLNEGRSRSKSRDRSSTPTSAGKIKGSVLSLFKTPRKSGASPSPGSRDVSPVVQQQRQFPQSTAIDRSRGEKLKYYEDSKDGIIHIPLHTPPDELDSKESEKEKPSSLREITRPASAPQSRVPHEHTSITPTKVRTPLPQPTQRTVLPDGSIIIPLHSPTEKTAKVESSSKIESTTIVSIKKTDKDLPPENILNNNPEPISDAVPMDSSPPVERTPLTNVTDHPKRKERFIFTTHVGSKEQVFSTQFSITKTPSVTSEISESIPSFPESEEVKTIDPPKAEFNRKNCEDLDKEAVTKEEMVGEIGNERNIREFSASPPLDTGRDSSESEASSEAAATHGGSEAERRGLVIQESFEELPYIPTTLPLERSLALPMIPVRDRGGVHVAGVQRPRVTRSATGALGALTPPSVPTPSAMPAEIGAERLHIRLPRRARAASTASATVPAPPPRSERARSRSGGDASGMEAHNKAEWIDFSEVPERRKLPKRIQTLPATARESVVFNYVPPERCRCECHAHAPDVPPDDELPLLQDDSRHLTVSSSSLEFEEDGGHVQVNVHIAPFTADLDLRHNHSDSTDLLHLDLVDIGKVLRDSQSSPDADILRCYIYRSLPPPQSNRELPIIVC